MKNLGIIFCIFTPFIFFSCEPNELVITYTIEGYIYADCDKLPLANEEIELFQEIETNILTGNSTGGILATGQTDENGHFVLTYSPENKSQVLIKTVSGNNLIGVPIDTNIDDLETYTNPSCYVEVGLNTLNSYTSSDTLYTTDFNNIFNVFKQAGPFENSILYVAENFTPIGMNYSENPFTFSYNINGGEWTSDWIYLDLDLQICDTNFVVIDIY